MGIFFTIFPILKVKFIIFTPKKEEFKLKVLFIGGTGIISSACSMLCLEKGFELYHLNRGVNKNHEIKGVKQFHVDIRDKAQVKAVIKDYSFDVVVNWIAYEPAHVMADYEVFKDKTLQYIFISSASVYQKPSENLPIIESEPLINPVWEYSQNKIACENYLMEMHRNQQFPVTIVRPSHTYDKATIPLHGGYTQIDRMLRDKPVIIHGDGTSLWTLTHHRDFAKGFIGLIGNPEAIGEDYHITSDEVLTWNQICELLANAAGVKPRIIHIPSDFINLYDKEWGDGLLGDKAHCLMFDNSKIKGVNPDYRATIPFKDGVKEILSWYQEDTSRQIIDEAKNDIMDKIIEEYQKGFEK